MKKLILLVLIPLAFFWSCDSSKKSTDSSGSGNAVNPIDGTWEANYMMNTPKPFDELYANAKPTITFSSADGKVSGMSGCNNFNGNVKLDGNKISFGEGMALTRKMCPDMAGETTFMETLKKVTSYSVSEEGKTLNLIMGDMAVMRLQKK